MLLDLKIENIAVIENSSIRFDKGLNVLTGETGAGKSIVIDSINAILGERTSKELIRSGTNNAKVVASFCNIGKDVIKCLDDLGIEKTDDNSLTISRSISLSGKNTCRVNGWPVTVGQLRELGANLINIHGQHDSQSLLDPEKHLSYLDSMAGNNELLNEYKNAFHSLIKTKKELDSLYDSRDEKAARLDYLNYVIEEINDANIKIGETESLKKEKAFLENSLKVQKLLEKSYSALCAEGGISESLSECASQLEKAAEYYDKACDPAKVIKSLSIELSDAASSVRQLSEGFSYSPSRMSEIDDRLDIIYRLSMKYGKTEEGILETLKKSVDEKSSIEVSDEKISTLEENLYKESDLVKELAGKLSTSRKNAAEIFEKQVSRELTFLDMPYVKFVVDIKKSPMTSKGAETVEFLISANPGQEPKSISKIASGGELSRIMLAIKNVLSDKDSIETLIFDEIDTGVSGSAAEKIALKLYQVSKGRQVICVTHLPRIAAQADCHLKIEKKVTDSGTFTDVIPLDFEGSAAEIARITAGNSVTTLQLETAKEMLQKAKEN